MFAGVFKLANLVFEKFFLDLSLLLLCLICQLKAPPMLLVNIVAFCKYSSKTQLMILFLVSKVHNACFHVAHATKQIYTRSCVILIEKGGGVDPPKQNHLQACTPFFTKAIERLRLRKGGHLLCSAEFQVQQTLAVKFNDTL